MRGGSKPKQFPGQQHTFINRKTREKDIGVLPDTYGASNDFAYWCKQTKMKNGGHWVSVRFHRAERIGRYRVRSEKELVKGREYHAANIEYESVKTHYGFICRLHKNYKEMAFHPDWDPRQGGSLMKGQDDIRASIGPRPIDGKYHLHVIRRYPDPSHPEWIHGFVPGNLCWMPTGIHRQEEMLSKTILENQDLKHRIKELEEIAGRK